MYRVMKGILLGAFRGDNMSDGFDRAIKSCPCKQSCDHQMMTFYDLYKNGLKNVPAPHPAKISPMLVAT